MFFAKNSQSFSRFFPAVSLSMTIISRECIRFRGVFTRSKRKSLILLNETFSTTSFEEGYYVTRDIAEKYGVQKLRNSEILGKSGLEMLCKLLECDISEIIEYVPETKNE